MTFGVRGKLFTGAIGLTLLVATASAAYLEPRLRGFIESRLTREVRRHAETIRGTLELAPVLLGENERHHLVAHTAGALGARVSIIAADGTVLADSEIEPAELASVPSHADRPEVVEALAHGIGSAQRTSATVAEPLVYVAARFAAAGSVGVVRIALPLSDIGGEIHRLRLLLFAAGLVGLFAAVLTSGLLAQVVSRPLRGLVEHVRSLAAGGGPRLHLHSHDELGTIAGSVDRVAAELEAAVATLARERHRRTAILESMSEAVLALGASGRVSLANRSAQELLRLPETVEGLTLLEATRLPALQRLIERATGAAGADEAEIELEGPLLRRVLARVRPLTDGGMVVVLHDVTDLRRLETVRRDFVANISHELRTPVSVIRANAETLASGALADPTRAQSFVEGIGRNAERLATLLADLLDIARIEAGRYELARRPVVVREALEAAAKEFANAAQAKRTTLRVDAPATGLQVEADAGALAQVLSNLVDNAVKYTPEGGEIVLAAVLEPSGMMRICVSDDGPGIEPRHRTRIFERFYRVDPGRSRQMGGTGLGLAIVKHLVEAMGGEVGVSPAAPHGSVFWFTLPQARSAAAVLSPSSGGG